MSKKNQATLFETQTPPAPSQLKPERKRKQELATLPPPQPPSVANMLLSTVAAIQSKQITAADVDVVSRMMDLYEREQKWKAEQDFAVAFHALMAEIPKIVAIKPVKDKDGNVKYYIAPLDEIDRQLRPMASKHGFTYRWEEGQCPLPDRITENCIIQHVGGHKVVSPYTVRRSAPPHANDSQADVSTHSYGRRGSLCDGFGIIIDNSDDARMIGKTITTDEARELKARVEHSGSDEAKFLLWANEGDEKGTYETISEDMYDKALKWLEKAEKKKAGATQQPNETQKISAEGAGNCVHCGQELIIEQEPDGGGVLFLHKATGQLKCSNKAAQPTEGAAK